MHRQKCYCGQSSAHSAGVGILRQMSNSRQQSSAGSDHTLGKQATTQFIKRSSIGRSSQQQSANDFSRRNSAATTVSHSCGSSSSCVATQQRQQQQSRVKVLNWGSEQMPSSSTSFTDNRRLYEQSECVRLAAAAGQGRHYAQAGSTGSPVAQPDDDLQRLLALQQFRLNNAGLCFSAERQHELRLQQGCSQLEAKASVEKQQKNQANASQQQASTKPAATMPYALRQKLLQLRLKLEQAESAGSRYSMPPLDSSCALRYN